MGMATSSPKLTSHHDTDLYFESYPGQPMKALWEAMQFDPDEEERHNLIMRLINDRRCGMETKLTEREGPVEGISGQTVMFGATPLVLATMANLTRVVKALIEAGADVGALTSCNSSPSHSASLFNEDIINLKILTENGATASAKNDQGLTPLHFVTHVQSGSHLAASHLLDLGAEVDPIDVNGLTPLLYAVEDNNLEIVKKLLAEGANVNQADGAAMTSLHKTAYQPYTDLTSYLIKCGANIHAINDAGRTPLHLAANFGRSATLEVLLSDESSATNAKDVKGDTPLHLCARSLEMGADQDQSLHCIRMLLERGRNDTEQIEAKNNDGQTPVHCACITGHHLFVQELIKKGARLTVVDNRGQTPLHHAVMKAPLDVIVLLVNEGANLNAVNSGGLTPYDCFVSNRTCETSVDDHTILTALLTRDFY